MSYNEITAKSSRYQLLHVPFPESMAVIGPLVKQLENPLELDRAASSMSEAKERFVLKPGGCMPQ